MQKQTTISDLNKLSSDPQSWYSILNEPRNRSIHRNMLNKKDAIKYLERAISSDQRYKQWANKEEAFKELRNNPEFEKMIKYDF